MGLGLLWIAMFVTVWSGIDYFRKFFKLVFYRVG
jgi:phosphatidylglycerophosphate synthase